MSVGLIINGRCLMAPHRLDLRKQTDYAFMSMARNGICVAMRNGTVAAMIRAYDEQEGWAEVAELDSFGRIIPDGVGGFKVMRIEGEVRAIPGLQ